MKRGEKSEGGPAKKEEYLGEKLKRVEKRGGHSTPVIPFWRIQFLAAAHSAIGEAAKDSIAVENLPKISLLSARKLAATFWELHQYNLPLSKMHQGLGVPPPRLRRLHPHRNHHHPLYDDKAGLEPPPDPSPSSPELPATTSSLGRHVAASLLQHHRSIERSNRAIQPVSPASYGSSMEMAPYNPAMTPSSSLDFKGRIGEPHLSLKTSTELLKVLNRIWSLEEQHASNITLVKALKKELDHARAQIKELVRVQQSDRRQMDELLKRIAEDKLVRKSKEQDRINNAIQSARDELEDERKLRKRSESLHRKQAREVHDMKSSFANALKDLERERKLRVLLEDLCDEFAWGIRDYENEVHAFRQKSDIDWSKRSGHDRVILHVSESWLDERMQSKLEHQAGLADKLSVVEKLSSEIQTFLKNKQIGRGANQLQSSLESMPFNTVTSAPQDDADEEDSAGSDSNCFELQKTSAVNLKGDGVWKNHAEEALNLDYTTKRGKAQSTLQANFDEHLAQGSSHGESKNHTEDIEWGKTTEGNPEDSILRSEICEGAEEGTERKKKVDGSLGVSSNFIVENLIRGHQVLPEGGGVPPENEHLLASSSVWMRHASPFRQWSQKLPSADPEVSESSSKFPQDSKQHTLKAKLLEARNRGQRSRSRLKGSKIIF